MVVPDRDAHALDNVADQLDRSEDMSESLQVVTSCAVAAIPEIDVAGVSMLTSGGAVETFAPTDPMAVKADLIQQELTEGPLYLPDDEGQRLVISDLASEKRWPAYGPRLAELGLQSLVAARLRVDAKTRASLMLYARVRQTISGATHDLIEMFAAHASLVIDNAAAVTQLSEALRSRKVIGQALGLVMGQYDMSEAQAFAYIRRISQDRNIKLRDVCAQLVADHVATHPQPENGSPI